MNIAIFAYDYLPLSVYGIERHVERLSEFLSKNKHSILIVTRGAPNLRRFQKQGCKFLIYRTPSLSIPPGGKLKSVWGYLTYTFFSTLITPLLIKKLNIQLINGTGSYYGGWQAALAALLTRRPLVVTLHGYSVDYYAHCRKLPPIYHFLKWADCIIVQKRSATRILTEWGISRGKIFYIEEGAIDAKRFKPLERNDIKRSRYIAFVGRLIEFKDPCLLIEAAPFMLKRNSDVRFLIAGEGNLSQQLQKKIKDMGLDEKVHFLGVVQDIERVYQMSDAFVALSPYNNFSDLAMLEAMACGVPVVATNSGETHKTIKDGFNGFLVEPRNPYQLAEKILAILNTSNLAKLLGKNARETVLKDYTVEKFGTKMLNVFQQTLRQHRKN